MDISLWWWSAGLGAFLVIPMIDLFAHWDVRANAFRDAAAWPAFWLLCGANFEPPDIAHDQPGR